MRTPRGSHPIHRGAPEELVTDPEKRKWLDANNFIRHGKFTMYRVLGILKVSGEDRIWCYGSRNSAKRAVCVLKNLKKTKRYLRLPEDLRDNGFWIENWKGDDVTRKLLSRFILSPHNAKRKKMIAWATEEILKLSRPAERLENQ